MPLDPEPPSATVPLDPPNISALCSLIHGVQLPKSQAAKSCSVPLPTWKTICTMVSILAADTANNATSSLSSLSAQLSTIQSQLSDLSNMTSSSPTNTSKAQKPSYASIAASLPTARQTSGPRQSRNKSCDIILTPIDKRKPAFTAVAPADIQKQFNALMTRLKTTTEARAVAKHRNGNIRLTLSGPAHVQKLHETRESWLPAFSHLLTFHSPTYAVVVHRVPTTLDVTGYDGPYNVYPDSFGSPGLDQLFTDNGDLDCSEITRIHWISPKATASKKFSSLVLHFNSMEAADHCIFDQVALHGTLLRTEKFHPRPAQCFNCHRFGHIARNCTQTAICGQCAGPHPTNKCHCPHQPPCNDNSKCSHIVYRCALRECNGAHSAFSPDCPVRHAILARLASEQAANGLYFGEAPTV